MPRAACALTLLLLLITMGAPHAAARDAYLPPAADGPHRVAIHRLELTDRARGGRAVPLKIYLPLGLDAPAPVVLFSHGLGGSREGYEFLGRYWATHGYASLHPQHAGSDEAVWRDATPAQRMRALRVAASSATVALDRAHDVPFVLDELEKLNADADSPLHGRLDLEHVALAGHSFGAWSALVGGGQSLVSPSGRTLQVNDERIDAIIPLSAPVPRGQRQREKAFDTVAVPALHMTGTRDASPIGRTEIEDRRVPFDQTPGPDAGGPPSYLIILTDADHMTFAGQRRRAGGDPDAARLDPTHHTHIKRATLAFLDAYLRQNIQARAWLDTDGLTTMLREDATVERKP